MRKLLTFLLSLMMVVSCSTIAFSETKYETHQIEDVYKLVRDDYCYLTGITHEKADEYFNSVSEYGVSKDTIIFVENLIPAEKISIEEKTLYIQGNYQYLNQDLNESGKEKMDKYFLLYAIKYYLTDINAYNDLKEIYNFDKLLESQLSSTKITPYATATNVCKLTVFSDKSYSPLGSSGLNTGIDVGKHAWLRFQNTSSSSIKVGGLSVPAGSAVTIGTWGNKSPYVGAWYNLEAKYIAGYTNRYSKSINISSATLNTLSTVLKGFDDWSSTSNCSAYARIVWNRSGGTILSSGVVNTPKALADSIISTGSYSKNASCTAMSTIYYNATSPKKSTAY